MHAARDSAEPEEFHPGCPLNLPASPRARASLRRHRHFSPSPSSDTMLSEKDFYVVGNIYYILPVRLVRLRDPHREPHGRRNSQFPRPPGE